MRFYLVSFNLGKEEYNFTIKRFFNSCFRLAVRTHRQDFNEHEDFKHYTIIICNI